MTALQKLGVAFATAAGGAEIVVWAAADTPAHPGVQTALTVVLGAIAFGVGAGFALGAAFNAGRGEETAVAAPLGIPPWRTEHPVHVHMRERPATAAPEPVRPEVVSCDEPVEDADDFVWDGTFTPEAEAEIRAGLARDAHLYARPDIPEAVTQVDMAPVETTRQIPVAVSLPPWTPVVAPNVVAAEPARVEFAHALGGRHAAPERPRPDMVTNDWFRRPADRQESAA